jgi:hypothetical protein
MTLQLGGENYDLWRYENRYKYLYTKLEDTTQNAYSEMNPLVKLQAQVFRDILSKFEQKEDYKDFIMTEKNSLREKLDPSTYKPEIEEVSRYLILCQLADDEKSLTNFLREVPIEFFSSQLVWHDLKAYEGRRNLEIYIKTVLCHNLDFKKSKDAWEDIYAKAKIVIAVGPDNRQHLEYQGLYKLDTFLWSIILMKLVQIEREEKINICRSNPEANVFAVEYLIGLLKYINDPWVIYFANSRVKSFMLWQILQVVLSFISIDIIDFDDFCKKYKEFDLQKMLAFYGVAAERNLECVENWSQLFLVGIIIYSRIQTGANAKPKPKTNKPKLDGSGVPEDLLSSRKKYEEKNIFDIKLREFSIINFSNLKMKLDAHGKEIIDEKIPGLMWIFSEMKHSSANLLSFYNNLYRYFSS